MVRAKHLTEEAFTKVTTAFVQGRNFSCLHSLGIIDARIDDSEGPSLNLLNLVAEIRRKAAGPRLTSVF